MVTLLSDNKGQLYSCSQVQDYVFRGPEMAHCCLLAFAIDTWEETYSKDEKRQTLIHLSLNLDNLPTFEHIICQSIPNVKPITECSTPKDTILCHE